MAALYKFRLNDRCNRVVDFIKAVGEAYNHDTCPIEVLDMYREYDRSDTGRTTTTSKVKADIFLDWLSGIEGWGKHPHPIKWRVD